MYGGIASGSARATRQNRLPGRSVRSTRKASPAPRAADVTLAAAARTRVENSRPAVRGENSTARVPPPPARARPIRNTMGPAMIAAIAPADRSSTQGTGRRPIRKPSRVAVTVFTLAKRPFSNETQRAVPEFAQLLVGHSHALDAGERPDVRVQRHTANDRVLIVDPGIELLGAAVGGQEVDEAPRTGRIGSAHDDGDSRRRDQNPHVVGTLIGINDGDVPAPFGHLEMVVVMIGNADR